MPTSDTDAALEVIRTALLSLDPSGEEGFEGVLASTLSALSGLNIRLAKSGFQGGRDGTSDTSAPFAIAMEAKLYSSSMSLNDLAGKVVMAAHYLDGRVDLWAVGASSAIGDDALIQLTAILEERGISMLALDWSRRASLPPLAVSIASVASDAITWFRKFAPSVDADQLEAALDKIQAAPTFPQERDSLAQKLNAANVGLDALRRRNAAWLASRFSDRIQCLSSFGQWIGTGVGSGPALRRDPLIQQLGATAIVGGSGVSITAVLGDEGTGKTWLAVQWWRSLPEPPILILVAGRRADLLDPSDPIRTLAKLLAQQDGASDEAAVKGWLRRLRRWESDAAVDNLRFLIVLDGLNERAGFAWGEIIQGLAQQVKKLGGALIVTCRQAYWKRDVLPRIPALQVGRVVVGGYSDDELTQLLQPAGTSLDDLPPKVRNFIRNPRVCAVALRQLQHLLPHTDDLTVERLLLEYWRSRLEDRGGLIQHNVEDFHKLLRQHASEWRKAPKAAFDRDDWAKYSGPARRLGLASVGNDLSEIEEGQFLTVTSTSLQKYEFRKETLPFALGLLINEEITEGLGTGEHNVEYLIDRILDPIRSFDQLAEILSAAIGLACMDSSFPAEGRVGLIVAWLRLQNGREAEDSSVGAYVSAFPDAFLDAAELPTGTGANFFGAKALSELILESRDRPAVQSAFQQRRDRWLGTWCRPVKTTWDDAKINVERQTERDSEIAEKLAALLPAETDRFRRITAETERPTELLLDKMVALMIGRRPQVEAAMGVIAWAFARAVAADHPDGASELAWSIRLNELDQNELRDRVWAGLADIDAFASLPARQGAAIALRLLGDRASAEKAEGLSSRGPRRYWRRVESFCDTDPYDPAAPPGTNLTNALVTLARLAPGDLWIHMSATTQLHDLEGVLPALARFHPTVIIAKLNLIVRTVTARKGLPLRQLSWNLPWLAPILDATNVDAIRSAYHAILADTTRAPSDSVGLTVSQLACALIPIVEPEEQLTILLKFPPGSIIYRHLQNGLRPLGPERLEFHLEGALAAGSVEPLKRVLAFAAGAKPELTRRSRQIVADALYGKDNHLAWIAADVAVEASDPDLFEEILRRELQLGRALDNSDEGIGFSRAVTTAILQLRRSDLLRLVPGRHLGLVCSRFGDDALQFFGRQIAATFERLLQPVSARPPDGLALFEAASDQQLEVNRWFEGGLNQSEQDNPLEAFGTTDKMEASARRYTDRMRDLSEEVSEYHGALAREAATALAEAPSLAALSAFAGLEPIIVAGWLNRILSTTDRLLLRQITNLGLATASAFVATDAVLSAAVFRHLRSERPFIAQIVEPGRLHFYEWCLFRTDAAPELDDLRQDAFQSAFNDEDLEHATMAAEIGGANAWLDEYADRLFAIDTPVSNARAITISGFRFPNEKSREILAMNWGGDFLRDVAIAASEGFDRAVWADEWLRKAVMAAEPVDFWRFSELAVGIADRRLLSTLADLDWSVDHLVSHGELLETRIIKASTERSEKRRKTLFGQTAPSDEVRDAVSF